MTEPVRVIGLEELRVNIGRQIDRASPAAVGRAIARGAEVVERAAKTNIKRHDLILTGDLRASIRYIIRENKTGADALIGTDKIYAAIHEFGGVITPKSAPALVFEIDGQLIITQSVTIPERPYLRPALDDNKPAIFNAVAKSLKEELGI